MSQVPEAVVASLVVDCSDPAAVAEFWQAMLGGEIVAFDAFGVVALRAPGVTFDFVQVDETKQVKNRWHLDVSSADQKAMVERAVGLGASIASDMGPSERFTVLRDVEGNEFCVVGYRVDGPWVPPDSSTIPAPESR